MSSNSARTARSSGPRRTTSAPTTRSSSRSTPAPRPRTAHHAMSTHISNVRPEPDKVLTDIADYALGYDITSPEAYETARYCLVDTLGCGLEALTYPACTKLMGPIVAGTV